MTTMERAKLEALQGEARLRWAQACRHDGIEADASFAVFSDDNPHQAAAGRAAAAANGYRAALETVRRAREQQGSFLTDADLTLLAEHDRLRPVLVRCGGGRFTAPAQDVRHFAAIIAAEGTDHVRDWSLLPEGS
jgi:hypothetical protein